MSVEAHNVVAVDDKHLLSALEVITSHVGSKIEKHGRRAYVSRHEGFGIIMEEVFEMTTAIRDNGSNAFSDEVKDVAVGCIWLLASMIATTEAFETLKAEADAAK
jgi:NTP pyrophosphatase (non-canonical NTP hydrolase)